MSDLIRRQDAISALKALEESAPTTQHVSAIFDCEDTIRALPSAEPERKWIPVTEALPEEETTVLVSAHYDGDKYYRYKPNDYVTTAEYIEGRWCFSDEEFIMQLHKHHVIAWMPLPEVYRGE